MRGVLTLSWKTHVWHVWLECQSNILRPHKDLFRVLFGSVTISNGARRRIVTGLDAARDST